MEGVKSPTWYDLFGVWKHDLVDFILLWIKIHFPIDEMNPKTFFNHARQYRHCNVMVNLNQSNISNNNDVRIVPNAQIVLHREPQLWNI